MLCFSLLLCVAAWPILIIINYSNNNLDISLDEHESVVTATSNHLRSSNTKARQLRFDYIFIFSFSRSAFIRFTIAALQWLENYKLT